MTARRLTCVSPQGSHPLLTSQPHVAHVTPCRAPHCRAALLPLCLSVSLSLRLGVSLSRLRLRRPPLTTPRSLSLSLCLSLRLSLSLPPSLVFSRSLPITHHRSNMSLSTCLKVPGISLPGPSSIKQFKGGPVGFSFRCLRRGRALVTRESFGFFALAKVKHKASARCHREEGTLPFLV